MGGLLLELATVAVIVTPCPKLTFIGFAVNAGIVGINAEIFVGGEVVGAKFESPLYFAVIA
jgi:hypothetical protein